MSSSILKKVNSTIIETEDITIQTKEPSIILTTKTIVRRIYLSELKKIII